MRVHAAPPRGALWHSLAVTGSHVRASVTTCCEKDARDRGVRQQLSVHIVRWLYPGQQGHKDVAREPQGREAKRPCETERPCWPLVGRLSATSRPWKAATAEARLPPRRSSTRTRFSTCRARSRWRRSARGAQRWGCRPRATSLPCGCGSARTICCCSPCTADLQTRPCRW